MSFVHLQKKNKKKKLEFFRFQVGPGSVIPEADPHQNEADPKHCITVKEFFFYLFPIFASLFFFPLFFPLHPTPTLLVGNF